MPNMLQEDNEECSGRMCQSTQLHAQARGPTVAFLFGMILLVLKEMKVVCHKLALAVFVVAKNDLFQASIGRLDAVVLARKVECTHKVACAAHHSGQRGAVFHDNRHAETHRHTQTQT